MRRWPWLIATSLTVSVAASFRATCWGGMGSLVLMLGSAALCILATLVLLAAGRRHVRLVTSLLLVEALGLWLSGRVGPALFVAQVKARLPEYEKVVIAQLLSPAGRPVPGRVLTRPSADIAWADVYGSGDALAVGERQKARKSERSRLTNVVGHGTRDWGRSSEHPQKNGPGGTSSEPCVAAGEAFDIGLVARVSRGGRIPGGGARGWTIFDRFNA